MKLTIDKIKYGITPYGADYGNHSLAVYIKAAEGDYGYTRESLLHISDDEQSAALTDEDIAGYGLVDDLMAAAHNANLGDKLNDYMLGNAPLYFVGDDFTDDAYRNVSMKFFEKISFLSKNMQLAAIRKIAEDRKLDEKSAIMHYIRAPFSVFVGSPVNYTGVDQFYENFNFIIMKLNPCLKEPAPIAAIEAQNHKFASMVIEANDDNIDEICQDLEEKWVKTEIIRAIDSKFFFIDTSDKPSEKVKEAAVARGWRIQRKLDYSGVLEL